MENEMPRAMPVDQEFLVFRNSPGGKIERKVGHLIRSIQPDQKPSATTNVGTQADIITEFQLNISKQIYEIEACLNSTGFHIYNYIPPMPRHRLKNYTREPMISHERSDYPSQNI